MRQVSIAIDGPAGAGKSTVAKRVASKLGLLYVDTGAMYRGVAWLAVTHKVDVANELGVMNLLRDHRLHFERNETNALDVYVDGEQISAFLRSPEVSNCVSQLSVHPNVRQLLTQWQRDFAARYSVVMDGRDIGTVVIPSADVKVFLTASLDERAKRRAEEFSNKGFSATAEDLKGAISERDTRDSSRDIAPLRFADDAHSIDSTGKSVEEVVDEILHLVEQVTHG
jgi:cytidylate kinase